MKSEECALENLAVWSGAGIELIRSHLTEEQLAELCTALVVQPIPRYERVLRVLLQPVLGGAPPTLRAVLTGLLKRARNLKGNRLKDLRGCFPVRLLLELKEVLGIDGINWNGAKSVVCLTHDVDNCEGYRFVENVVAMEERFGVRSSFNFLTGWDYQIDPELIFYLNSTGYEVGLHGFIHDLALGFRGRQEIRRQIAAAIEALPIRAKGFRAPALAISRELLSVLEELGFAYDSSFPVTSRYFRGVETCFPYRYPGLNLWEVPLTIQDDTLFRDMRLSEEEGFQIVKGLVEQVRTLGGVAVINTHPCIIRKRPGFYLKLLEYLREQEGTECMPIGVLIQYMEECRKSVYINQGG